MSEENEETPGDTPADETPPAGGDGAAGEGGEGEGGEGDGQPQGYRPEGLADELAGANDQETIDKLLEGLTKANERAEGLREKLAQKPGAPKTADEYPDLKFSDDFIAKHGNPAPKDDPMLGIIRDRALAAGITPDAYNGFVTGVLEAAAEQGILEAPFDQDAEFEKAGGKDAYERRMRSLDQRFEGLVSQGKLTAEQRELAKAFQATADGMGLFEAVFGLAGEKGVQLDGDAASAASKMTVEAVRRDMRDDRYQRGSAKFDPAFAKEVDERAAKVFKDQ
ncbi:hypothetical protein [Maricaulis sp.]|uniref:hypothetical protein n=1 Tax=Maricaulis sp. TaxID=1486257 RepID=UPI00329747D2